MIVIGITGSIATGKTFISSLFSRLNFPVFNYDTESHNLILEDNIINQIVNYFPECFVNNVIDRKILGDIVFYDKSKIKILESIIHPFLEDRREIFINNNKDKEIVVVENQLIYETDTVNNYDYIIATYTDYNIQKKRALSRKNMSLEKFNMINNLQIDSKIKISKADFIIDTNIESDKLFKNIKILVKDLLNNQYTNNIFYREIYNAKNST